MEWIPRRQWLEEELCSTGNQEANDAWAITYLARVPALQVAYSTRLAFGCISNCRADYACPIGNLSKLRFYLTQVFNIWQAPLNISGGSLESVSRTGFWFGDCSERGFSSLESGMISGVNYSVLKHGCGLFIYGIKIRSFFDKFIPAYAWNYF